MKEQLSNQDILKEPIKTLMLQDLQPLDVLRITNKLGEILDFTVLDSRERPEGLLSQTFADGSKTDWVTAILDGSGTYTDQKQNPVQTQESAISLQYGIISLDQYVVVRNPDTSKWRNNRVTFNHSGQEISEITIDRFSE